MSVNPTLERLTSKSTGLLANPFFEKLYGTAPDGTDTSVSVGSLRVQGILPFGFGDPPGWRTFGNLAGLPTGAGTLANAGVLPDTVIRTQNPFWVSDGYDGAPGIAVTVHPGIIGGYFQKLGGSALVGKKVRISGAYRPVVLDTDATPIPVGMSVWIKSDIKSAVAQGNPLTGTASGSITATPDAPSNTFTSAVSLGNVTAGDLLVIEGSDYVYQINSTPVGAGPYTVTIDGYFTETIAGADWYISRREPGGTPRDANWMGKRGIGLTASSSRPGAILRVTEPDADWDAGIEWFNPALDPLTLPTTRASQGSGTDGATSTVSVTGDTFTSASATFETDIPATAGTPVYATYIYFDGDIYGVDEVISDTELRLSGSPAYPAAGLSSLDYVVFSAQAVTDASAEAVLIKWSGNSVLDNAAPADAFWPGVVCPGRDGGATPNAEQAEVWYLDSNVWSGAAAGALELTTQAVNSTAAVRYFDEIVEIDPALLVSAQDELYLVVMPVDPADIASIVNPVTVIWYALKVELIPEVDSDKGVRDRLFRDYLDGSLGSPSPSRGGRASQILRHPVYVPFDFAIDPWELVVKNQDFTDITRNTTLGNHSLRFGDGSSAPVTSDELIWFIPRLPFGSFLTSVELKATGTSAGDVNIFLQQTFSDSLDYGAAGPVTAISETYLQANPQQGATFGYNGTPKLWRHIVGLPWPLSDDSGQPSALEADHGYTPSRLSIHIAPVAATTTWDFTVLGIRVKGFYDLRMLNGAPVPGVI